jgi:pimeloyl-ACP methyl ester carboxylesterase
MTRGESDPSRPGQLTWSRTAPTLHTHRWGVEGPVLVLLHGLGASGRSWRLVAERLAPNHRVVCPDLLGFGQSPWPAAAYTVQDHLAALMATLDRLDIAGPILLAGHSTGAVLALEWAAADPERVAGAALLSLPAYRSAEEARACIASLSLLAWATVTKPHLGEVICGMMCAWRPLWQRVVPLLARRVPRDIARDYVLHHWTSYSNTLQNVLIEHRVMPAAARLAASGTPVRLLHGDRDTVAPLGGVRELAALGRWPLRVVDGGDHHLPVRHPATCAAFLRACSTDRTPALI